MNQIEIISGPRRLVAEQHADGWRPVGLFLGDQLRLRFKDDAFLSVNTLRPAAERMERVGDGARFAGRADYHGLPVEWSVTIRPEPGFDGFTIETHVTPVETMEFYEVFTFLETPAEYDGSEEQLHVIGMNPVAKWQGEKRVSPELWWNPIWTWEHKRTHKNLAPTQSPFLCTRLTRGDASRYVTLFGHWDACDYRMLAVVPGWEKPGRYQFQVGAMTWRASLHKDPNYILEGGRTYRQKISVSVADELPGGTLDRWFFRPWSFSLRRYFPGGHLGEASLARAPDRHGASLEAAARWFGDVLTGDSEVPGLYHPEKGTTAYCPGSHPTREIGYGHTLTTWWVAGWVAYHSAVIGPARWREDYRRLHSAGLLQAVAEAEKLVVNTNGTAVCGPAHGAISMLRYLRHVDDPALRAAVEKLVATTLAKSQFNEHGTEAQVGLMAAEAGHGARALELLAAAAKGLDDDFWSFSWENSKSGMACRGQMHMQGPAAAIHLAVWAYRHKGEEQYRELALRLARNMVALCYATFNDSADPEFDCRGWANGGTSGRDLFAEFPPWESSEGIRALAAVLEVADVPEFYDLIWYFSRSYLACFPAARRNKRGYAPDGTQKVWFNDAVRSEAVVIRARYPYVAYEDPVNQTLQASYQTIDVFPNYLAFGGGLASADDDRLLVLCPRVARADAGELRERHVRVWNPTGEAIAATITAHWPEGRIRRQPVTVPPRSALNVELHP